MYLPSDEHEYEQMVINPAYTQPLQNILNSVF